MKTLFEDGLDHSVILQNKHALDTDLYINTDIQYGKKCSSDNNNENNKNNNKNTQELDLSEQKINFEKNQLSNGPVSRQGSCITSSRNDSSKLPDGNGKRQTNYSLQDPRLRSYSNVSKTSKYTKIKRKKKPSDYVSNSRFFLQLIVCLF